MMEFMEAIAERLREWCERGRDRTEAPCGTACQPRDGAEIDLTRDSELFFELLDTWTAWRERSIHEFVLRDSDHVELDTSYQVRLPVELLREHDARVQPGSPVRLRVPFAVREKQLLLNVDLRGPDGGPASLVRRAEAAGIQAAYLSRSDGIRPEEDPLGDLWGAVGAYIPFSWQVSLDEEAPRWWGRFRHDWKIRWREQALATHLTEGTQLGIDVGHVRGWLADLDRPRRLLVEALDEGEDPASPAECILLAIPFMSYAPDRIEAIDQLVDDFVDRVEAMEGASRLLLAEFGRRWVALTETVVPAGQSCSVKMSEQRLWKEAPSPVLAQDLPFDDATTAHVEVRAADNNVVVGTPQLFDQAGRRVGHRVIDWVRVTSDAAALYSAAAQRPHFVQLRIRARVRWWLRWLHLGLILLVASSCIVALVLPENRDLVDSLAVLVFPATLAGTVVLAREGTSLAERLLRRTRRLLAVAIGALWFLTLSRLLLGADVAWAEATVSWLRDLRDWVVARIR